MVVVGGASLLIRIYLYSAIPLTPSPSPTPGRGELRFPHRWRRFDSPSPLMGEGAGRWGRKAYYHVTPIIKRLYPAPPHTPRPAPENTGSGFPPPMERPCLSRKR